MEVRGKLGKECREESARCQGMASSAEVVDDIEGGDTLGDAREEGSASGIHDVSSTEMAGALAHRSGGKESYAMSAASQRLLFSAEARVGLSESTVAGQGAFRPEGIFGGDDRLEVQNTRAVPYRAICHLEIRGSRGETLGFGTGWFSGPRTIVTAGHCVFHKEKLGGWAKSIIAYPGRKGNQVFEQITGTRFRTTTEWWTDHDNAALDYGAILLDQDYSGTLGYFGFADYSDDELRSMLVNVVGYPGELGSRMFSHAGRVDAALRSQLRYRLDTTEGQSGCAVVRWDGRQQYYVVGIHNYGPRRGDNSPDAGNLATRITPGVREMLIRWKLQAAPTA